MSTSRLQNEVDVLIIDFEKVIYQNTKQKRRIYFIIETYWSIQANSTTWEMQKRSKQLELINIEFKSKLD
jgi:hypothetical protein